MARILVVDDEAIITMQLEGCISSMGHKVIGMAASGDDAIAKAQAMKPEIILMDIVMPGKTNGIAAAKEIYENLGIPVILITSYADDKIIDEAKKANPYGYIVKPFNERELKASIELALFRKKNEGFKTGKRKPNKMHPRNQMDLASFLENGEPGEGPDDVDTFIEPDSRLVLLNNFYQGIILILSVSSIINEPIFKNAIGYGIMNGYQIYYAYFQSKMQKYFLKEIQLRQLITHRIKPGDIDSLFRDLKTQLDFPSESARQKNWQILLDFSEVENFEKILEIKEYLLSKKGSGLPVSGIIILNIENLSHEQITAISSGITKVIISTGTETSVSIASQSYPLESLSVVPQAVVNEIVKKSLEPLVLSILTKPISGYDIVHEIHSRYNVLIPQSRVYAILYELETNGIVTMKLSGKAKLYEPTQAGKIYIRQKLNEFKCTFQHIFGGMNYESQGCSSGK